MMKKPSGKNPFELGTYINKFPLPIKWLYEDFTSGLLNFEGKCSRAQFWNFYAFAFLFTCALGWIATSLAENDLIQAIVLVLGWLWIAVPAVSIGVRRLHDMGGKGVIATIPPVATLGILTLLCAKDDHDFILYAVLGFFIFGSLFIMSLSKEVVARYWHASRKSTSNSQDSNRQDSNKKDSE